MTKKQALEALDRMFDYCEEIDLHLPPEEQSGYNQLNDYLAIRRYINEEETYENTQFIGAKTDARPVFLYGDGYADGSMVYDTAECPNCGYTLDDDFDFDKPHEPYCPHCGQLLDWNIKSGETE